ncbi:MAG: hypothetical protein CMD29_05120 [Flavobacteriales bacterium]|nr:hypothetical protein [Flavobacteriales bacterium]
MKILCLNKILIFFLISSFSFSQVGTGSPYSFIGFGETNFRGNHSNRAMGGLDIYIDSIHPNINNPASYSTLKATTYSIGLNYRKNNISNNSETQKITTSSIDYMGVSIPTKKFRFGFGIIPVSSIGYLLNESNQSISENQVINRFSGEGGLNRAFLNVGFRVFKGIHAGFSTNYGFGDILYEKNQLIKGIQNGSYLESELSLSGISYKFALNSITKLNKVQIHGHFSFEPEGTLKSKNRQVIYTQSVLTESTSVGEVVEPDLSSTGTDETIFKSPKSISFGSGIAIDKKWFFGGQITNISNSSFVNNFINQPNIRYIDEKRVNFGGFFIPDYSSITSYWKRIVYRFGYRTEKKGYVINNESINENVITFGFGLPMAGVSNTNVTFELGKIGNKNNNLVEENYLTVRVGFSLNDVWFIKRKYN